MILLAYLTGTVTGTLGAWAWHRYAGALLWWLFTSDIRSERGR